MRTTLLLWLVLAFALVGGCAPLDRDARGGRDHDAGEASFSDDDGSGASSCGDGSCDGAEACESCEVDCGACGWPAAWSAAEAEVFRLVNEARSQGATCPSGPTPATHPLVWNDELALAARLHSLDMAEQGYFSHTSLDGRSPWDRIADAGYTGAAVGENIAAGSSTAAQAFGGWMSSDGHCRNIMSSDSNELGVGYAALESSPWGHYWTQTFGAR